MDQATLDNVFCQNVSRDPATGFVSNVFAGPQNVANFDTAGLDVTANYHFTISPALGSLNLRVVGGYLDKLTFISTNGAQPDSDVNEQFSPRYIGTFDATWNVGNVTVNYGLSWQGKTRRFTTEQLAANPDRSDPRYFFYKERWEHDIYLAFNVKDRFAFYGGVNNFTNQKPDVGVYSYPVSAVGRLLLRRRENEALTLLNETGTTRMARFVLVSFVFYFVPSRSSGFASRFHQPLASTFDALGASRHAHYFLGGMMMYRAECQDDRD